MDKVCMNCKHCQIIEFDNYEYQYLCLIKRFQPAMEPEGSCSDGEWDND